jgi:hypothetical protein
MPTLKYSPAFEYMKNLLPSKLFIPKWFKDLSPVRGEPTFREKRVTVKVCSPFLDALTAGYMITLPGDVIIEQDVASIPFATWGHRDLTIVSTRDKETMGDFPWPNIYEDTAFTWRVNINICVPKGYSALLTHPLNRADLPFYTFSGVIDDFTMYNGDMPFLLKKGFTGLIPIGTPIAQVIPFKRENWKSIRDESILKEAELNQRATTAVFKGWYKNTIWKKKTYE